MLKKFLKSNSRGLVLVIVIAFLAILLPLTWVIVNLGLGEILQARAGIDRDIAFYAASAGEEMMYCKLKAIENSATGMIVWGDTISGIVRTQPPSSGVSVGTYTTTVNNLSGTVFGVVSQGTANGKTASLCAKYGYTTPFTHGVPLGCRGAIEMYGHRWWILTSWVRAEGPVASGSTVTTNSYVQITGDTLQNQSFTDISYWIRWDAGNNIWVEKEQYDTDGDGSYVTDVSGDGVVTVADCLADPVKEAEFAQDNTYTSDTEINDKDAFYTFYTFELEQQQGELGISPGEANYHSGDTLFGPSSVPAGTSVVFVDGDANILFNAANWSGGASDITIVAMDDINIVQPTNGSDDRVTLIAYDDVNTGGVGIFGGISGDWVVYAGDDFNAYFGGNSNGTIFADDHMTVDTVAAIPGLLTRDFDKGTVDWSDPDNVPLGLPSAYPRVSYNFRISDETQAQPAGYIPVWHRY